MERNGRVTKIADVKNEKLVTNGKAGKIAKGRIKEGAKRVAGAVGKAAASKVLAYVTPTEILYKGARQLEKAFNGLHDPNLYARYCYWVCEDTSWWISPWTDYECVMYKTDWVFVDAVPKGASQLKKGGQYGGATREGLLKGLDEEPRIPGTVVNGKKINKGNFRGSVERFNAEQSMAIDERNADRR